MEFGFDHTLEIAGVEVDVRVAAVFHPAEPMVRYYPDGSGDPGCPAEIEIVLVIDEATGKRIELTDEQREALEEIAMERGDELSEEIDERD
jgi:hypothetical protein